MTSFIVASIGEWNKEVFGQASKHLVGEWYYCSSPEELSEKLKTISPRYIFFPHWRWIVPNSVLYNFECVCFHMTDVPYGRGGSPLQNLIIRGHKDTVMTALRMEEGLDTGPVYLKKRLSLDGPAHEIYRRATELTWKMIEEIVKTTPSPCPQSGEPIVFKRRTPDESKLPHNLESEQVYNYIRMLDAPGYPKAFVEYGNYRMEFEDAEIQDDEVTARVRIKLKV